MILRPHHLICMNFFIGKGYSEKFTANMQNVISRLKADPKCRVILQYGEDVICGHCPNNGELTCAFAKKVNAYDKKILELCGLQVDEEYSFDFLAGEVKAHILSKKLLLSVCKDCSWFQLCNENGGLKC